MQKCPYNPHHNVKKTRFVHHLMKCRKQYQGVDLNFCIFNESHIFQPKDAIEHFETCPDRIPHTEIYSLLYQRSHLQKSLLSEHTLLKDGKDPQSHFEAIKSENESSKMNSCASSVISAPLCDPFPPQYEHSEKSVETSSFKTAPSSILCKNRVIANAREFIRCRTSLNSTACSSAFSVYTSNADNDSDNESDASSIIWNKLPINRK